MGAILKKEVIGGQTLILGDCLGVMPELGAFGHVISDPPYEDELHAAVGKFADLRNDGKSYRSNKIASFGFDGVNRNREEIARQCVGASNGWVILFSIAEGVRSWRDALQASGAKYDTCLAWVKPDCAPRFNGQGAARGFECAVTSWAGKGHRSWNAGGKRGIYIHNTNSKQRHGQHPTEKPVPLMSEIVSDFTNAGETIADPFMGSGTTLVACQRLGRIGTGIELDPDYFKIACERVHEAWRSPDLFIEEPKALPPQQLGLLDGDAA
jgi:site-specific DNA-methyltransferase (adenine-specific)